jgi:hypothetical protein
MAYSTKRLLFIFLGFKINAKNYQPMLSEVAVRKYFTKALSQLEIGRWENILVFQTQIANFNKAGL